MTRSDPAAYSRAHARKDLRFGRKPVSARRGRLCSTGPAGGGAIGRIGTSPDDTFFIGTERLRFRVRTSGRLYLGVNDDTLDDDAGAFQVAVTR